MTTVHTPRRTLSTFLVLAALSTVFLDYWQYSKSFHADPNIWSSILRGEASAPAQYRIGVLKAAELLALHAHLGMRHALAFIDFTALLVALFVLRSLLTRSATFRSASLAAQWFGAAAFVVLIEYSLTWLTWYQRPETLTIAACLALSLWLSTYRLPLAGSPLALILLGVLLGFIRADVGVTFNLGVALICLTRLGRNFALPRWMQFATSLAAAATAATVQGYLMRVVYPQATYGTTPVFQLLLNYTDHIRIVPFVLFLAPSVWVAVQVVRRRIIPHPAQAGLLLGAGISIGLWCVFGKIDEVRIFLPFSFALAPLSVEAAMHRLAAVENVSVTPDVF